MERRISIVRMNFVNLASDIATGEEIATLTVMDKDLIGI